MPFREVLRNSRFRINEPFFFFFFGEVISKKKKTPLSISAHAGHLTQTVLREISPGLRK